MAVGFWMPEGNLVVWTADWEIGQGRSEVGWWACRALKKLALFRRRKPGGYVEWEFPCKAAWFVQMVLAEREATLYVLSSSPPAGTLRLKLASPPAGNSTLPACLPGGYVDEPE
ncbi:MAG: hypothetical protein HYY09_06390 [Firmicutes bacterium]|nr:hypothetical protein [Bacillota bacterium]